MPDIRIRTGPCKLDEWIRLDAERIAWGLDPSDWPNIVGDAEAWKTHEPLRLLRKRDAADERRRTSDYERERQRSARAKGATQRTPADGPGG